MRQLIVFLEEDSDGFIITEKPGYVMDGAIYNWLLEYFHVKKLSTILLHDNDIVKLLKDGFIVRII